MNKKIILILLCIIITGCNNKEINNNIYDDSSEGNYIYKEEYPNNEYTKYLIKPDSNNISYYEYDNSISIYVEDISIEKYNNYIELLKNNNWNEYELPEKQDNVFSATNEYDQTLYIVLYNDRMIISIY